MGQKVEFKKGLGPILEEINLEKIINTTSADFVEKLSPVYNGIETVEQFEDAYSGQYRDGAEFSETLIDDCGYLEESSLPTFITNHIDWEDVWECELRHDYFMLTQDYKSHFFSRHF